MLVEGVPAILYIDRPDELSSNLYTSPQILEVLGYTVEEWMADPELWHARIHPDDRARVAAANLESNRAGDRYVDEYRLVAKDGSTVWMRDEAAPVRGDDGTLPHWRGVMLDITERKEAEEKLRRSLEVLHRTLQQRRELAQRLEHAQEEERRRIAADIHDDPIQVMSAVDLRLQLLAASARGVDGALGELQTEVRGAIERLRSLLFELRPTALDRDGLVPAILVYLAHTAATTGWSYGRSRRARRRTRSGRAGGAVPHRAGGRDRTRASTPPRRTARGRRLGAEGVMVQVHDDGAGFASSRGGARARSPRAAHDGGAGGAAGGGRGSRARRAPARR